MKRRIDDVIAKRSAAKDAKAQRQHAEGRAPLAAPSAKAKASSTPSFRALAIRAVIAIFAVLAVMYGLNVFMPMVFGLIGGGR
jgi:hypothetical protein